MKFKIPRDMLLKPLQQVTGVIERRPTLPVLSNVLLRTDDNQLSITGTDLEVEMIARIPLEDSEPGEITMPAQRLMDIVKELPEQTEIQFALQDRRCNVSAGRFKASLSTLPAVAFPAVEKSPTETSLRINSKAFKQLLDKTAFAIAQQDVRYFLNGMLIEMTPGAIRSVASDGHRLATALMAIDHDCGEKRLILPRKGVLELQSMLGEMDGDVQITMSANRLCADSADRNLTTKLIDGRYPDYDRVIPKNGDKEVIADRLELLRALNRTAIFSNEQHRGIRFTLKPSSLMLSANNPEQDEAEETVNVDYGGESLEVGFNAQYLQDVLGILEADKVKIVLHDTNSSALVGDPSDETATYVVMPMKL